MQVARRLIDVCRIPVVALSVVTSSLVVTSSVAPLPVDDAVAAVEQFKRQNMG